MNAYPFRAIEQDWPQGIGMLVALGVLAYTDEGALYATDGGAWRYIGPIPRVPTGTYDEDGNEILAPVVDDQGRTYLHANLETPHSLRALAEAAAAANPEFAEALANLARWVLTDEQGNVRMPNKPVERVWR